MEEGHPDLATVVVVVVVEAEGMDHRHGIIDLVVEVEKEGPARVAGHPPDHVTATVNQGHGQMTDTTGLDQESAGHDRVGTDPGPVIAGPDHMIEDPDRVTEDQDQVIADPGQVIIDRGQVTADPGHLTADPGQVSTDPDQRSGSQGQQSAGQRIIDQGHHLDLTVVQGHDLGKDLVAALKTEKRDRRSL